MKAVTDEDVFIDVVARINRYLVIMGVFFLIYFLFKTKVDIFLFLLAVFNMSFALLSHQHLRVTNRISDELRHAKIALDEFTRKTHEMHLD